MTWPGIEPGFTPWEGVVLTAWPSGLVINRGDVIRTRDLCVPNAALYQTEPRLDVFKALCFVLFTSDSYIIAWPWKKCKRFFEKISIFWKKVFSANLPGSRKTSQSLIYKEKQQSMGMGIMRCEQEEKCPESSQKPKKSKRNMKIQFKDR